MGNPWIIDPLHVTIRLLLALLLGGLIGLEREQNNHAAGFRTHILVCIGSTLIMLLSIYGFAQFANEPGVRMDPSRLAAQVVTGIGFLGAGVILFNGYSITGLTTAASLWVVAAIGLAIGAGFYYAASLSTLLVLFSLFVLNKVEQRLLHAKRLHVMKIKALDQPGYLGRISEMLSARHVIVIRFSTQEIADQTNMESPMIYITLTVKLPNKSSVMHISDLIYELEGVSEVTVE